MTWWYLSFADANRPKGTQWLGACSVEAEDFDGAVRASHRRELNLGGEVMGYPLRQAPPENMQNRTLSMDDLREWDRADGGDGVAVNSSTGEEVRSCSYRPARLYNWSI